MGLTEGTVAELDLVDEPIGASFLLHINFLGDTCLVSSSFFDLTGEFLDRFFSQFF